MPTRIMRIALGVAITLIMLVAVVRVGGAVYTADGDLDATFDVDGRVTTDFIIGGTGSFNDARGVAIQTDGKIVVVGTVQISGTNYNFGVTRYNPDGSLDTTFSDDGRLTTDFSTLHDSANGVAIQTDGKIVAGGVCSAYLYICFARYNSDGSLDASFGSDGNGKVSVTDYSFNYYLYCLSVALQDDGKIVAAGYVRPQSGGPTNFLVVQLNSNGRLDTSFDGDGILTTDIAGGDDEARAVVVQAGKIVVAGNAQISGSNYRLRPRPL